MKGKEEFALEELSITLRFPSVVSTAQEGERSSCRAGGRGAGNCEQQGTGLEGLTGSHVGFDRLEV